MHPLLDSYFKLIKKFIPNKPEVASFGLDIGSKECKIVEIKKSGEKFLLLNWAIEPLGEGNEVSTIKRLLEKTKNPCKSSYSAIFGKGTLIRYIQMPRMSIDDLKKSFAIEADKYFPFAQDEIYTDCYILDQNGKDKKMSVMVAATKKELVDQRLKLMSELSLTAPFIGINTIALANVVNVLGVDQEQTDDNAFAILDLGETVSSLTIVVDRLPRFTREIFVGGREFTKSISNAMGINFQEAEKLKNNPGSKIKDVVNAFESAIMNIVQELKLSFDYYATEGDTEIKTVLLTGGLSMLEGIVGILEKNLEMKIVQWNPFTSLEISPEVSSETVYKNSSKLCVALGLALYEYDSH